jgi:hypothetical protein
MPPAAPTQSVYVHAGDGPIDTTIWPLSGFQTPPTAIEGDAVPSEPLYYFSGDTTDPLTTNGASVPDWGLYTGPTEAVPAPVSTEAEAAAQGVTPSTEADPTPPASSPASSQPSTSVPLSEQAAPTESAPSASSPTSSQPDGTETAAATPGAPETPEAPEAADEASTPNPEPTEATGTAETAPASSAPTAPAIPGVVDGVVYRPRTDNDVLSGSFCRVINGEHQGRYGVFVRTATVFVNDGWPATVTVRTRDDRDEYLLVNYADIRPAQPGGR